MEKKEKKVLFMHGGDGGTGGSQLFWGYHVDKGDSRMTCTQITRKIDNFVCDACQKSFASLSGLKGHQTSRAHLDKLGLNEKVETRPHM